jgi:hypothetical protein
MKRKTEVRHQSFKMNHRPLYLLEQTLGVIMGPPKNSGYLNRAPEPVTVCPSATRCG